VLRIFIGLKNPSPWPGSNPQPLGPVASTLTTTPPRRPSTSTVVALLFASEHRHEMSSVISQSVNMSKNTIPYYKSIVLLASTRLRIPDLSSWAISQQRRMVMRRETEVTTPPFCLLSRLRHQRCHVDNY
jgi:hypothetical protein